MAQLDLEVNKRSLISPTGSRNVDMGAVARVRRLDQLSPEMSVAVSVGDRTTQIAGLDEGLYEVQLHLPSGQILSQQIALGSEKIETLSFNAGGSPAEYLGWQHFAGSVKGMAEREFSVSEHVSQVDLASVSNDTEETTYSASGVDLKNNATPQNEIRPRLLMVEAPAVLDDTARDDDRTIENWRLLAAGVKGDIKPVSMVRGFIRRNQKANQETADHETWRFAFAHEHSEGRRPPRRFALVQFDHGHELVSLPLPWRIDLHGNQWHSDDFVDLMVDKSIGRRTSRSNVMVRDEKYGGLLAYMNSGSLGLAGEMMRANGPIAQTALDLLYEKGRSPLGACAAGYILMATSNLVDSEDGSTRIAEWRSWIDNLVQQPLYHWIPDVSILGAKLVLHTAETREEAWEALPFLHRALRGGLPFYSMGLGWLLELLGHFRNEDKLIGALFNDVDLVARSLDVSQAFLVINISGSASE